MITIRPAACARIALVASTIAILTPYGAARAAASDSCAPVARSHVDARVHAAAAEGPDALRRFVQRTRMIYALDMTTEVARLDAEREARATCMSLTARATTMPVAARDDEAR